MGDKVILTGLFDELDPTVEALDRLRELGISDGEMSLMSGVPYSAEALGRPHAKSRMGMISIGSAVAGALLGVFLTMITPNLYVITVGGQAVIPGPPTAVLMYESIMLCLILGTFVGMVWLNWPKKEEIVHYRPAITDGKIGLVLHCRPEQEEAVREALRSHGAEIVDEQERRGP